MHLHPNIRNNLSFTLVDTHTEHSINERIEDSILKLLWFPFFSVHMHGACVTMHAFILLFKAALRKKKRSECFKVLVVWRALGLGQRACILSLVRATVRPFTSLSHLLARNKLLYTPPLFSCR